MDNVTQRSAIFSKGYTEAVVPAIALVNPKYPHNVAAALRAASCFGMKQVWFSGDRVALEIEQKKKDYPEKSA